MYYDDKHNIDIIYINSNSYDDTILKKKTQTKQQNKWPSLIFDKYSIKTAIYYVLRHELVTFQYKGDYISIAYRKIHTYNKQTNKLIKADSFLNLFCNVVSCTVLYKLWSSFRILIQMRSTLRTTQHFSWYMIYTYCLTDILTKIYQLPLQHVIYSVYLYVFLYQSRN